MFQWGVGHSSWWEEREGGSRESLVEIKASRAIHAGSVMMAVEADATAAGRDDVSDT